MTAVDLETPAIHLAVSGLLDRPVARLERLAGGRNSQVYKLTCDDASCCIAKRYVRHRLDDRDCLAAEFMGLQFLWEHGIRCIPRPIAADREHGWAVYEYLEGTPVDSQDVTREDLREAIAFLTRLHRLTRETGSRALPLAAEACFSVQAILDTLERRVRRLSAVRDDGASHAALRAFLAEAFLPSLEQVTAWCAARLSRQGGSLDAELEPDARTLSPSDFGFHNALRRLDGRLAFLDFEYFGWDDPAKMICDFLLHPAMALPEPLKQAFVSGMLGELGSVKGLARRVELVYPLFGLKWCLILLNEFVPEDLGRRRFANGSDGDRGALLDEQLAKAAQMLARIRGEHERFPYRP